jgi:FkbM family methyltransferase
MAAEPAATASADLWAGLFESELGSWVRRLARRGTRCIDVGANSGYYTLLFAARTRTPVIAYEPAAEARERLQRNLALNPWLAPYVDLRASLVGATATATATATGTGPVVTLDDDIPDPAGVGLLKIDVDGPEREVLEGARGLLAAARPHVIVETHAVELEHGCGQLLLDAGYRPRVLTARRRAPQDRGPQHNRWLVAVGGPELGK